MSNQQLHTRTPTVVVHDNRGSAIREISYCRHPDTVNQTDERITRHHYHVRGYLERSIDARLHEAQQSDSVIQANIQQTVSLGKALSLSQGVDNGNSFNFNDIEGTVAQQINAKGTVTIYKYSQSGFERYLEKVEEGKLGNSDTKVIQKFKWGQGNASELIDTNQVGKCIEHFDTAGKKTYSHYSLQGAVISETQQFIVGNNINWSTGSEQSIQQAEKFTTQYTYDATGAVLEETDAKGNKRRIAYDIAGFVKQTWLTLKGQSEQAILRALTYSAAGQKLREEQGNGLVTTYEYEPETQRLLQVKTERPQGHALGAKIMQDLRYAYDPVGNIICLKNDAEATRYWRNQKIVPENRYVYDSLYQLVSATGRESANQQTPASMQSQPVTTLVKDTQSYTNYTRFYTYDRGGNLTQIRHHSAIAQQSFTQDITVSNKTNRALLKSQCSEPQQVDSYFDESGNLTQLLNGDAIIWDSRNHLKATKEIMENGQLSEGETYQYNSASQRMMKIRGRKTANGNLERVTTHYLPNIEQWEVSTRSVTEKYVVVQIQTGTSAKVRALCWEIGSPKGIENNSLRYSYDDGIGNSGLETDGKGKLVSYEEYYPYGGTAIWSSENVVEVDYKTIRYSGKEKDSTGMYYYGYRYYQPWIGRWLSADPAGTIDGLNLYRMVRNNPVTLRDPDGRAPEKPNGFAWVKGKDGEELNFAGMSLFAENENIDAKAEYLAKEGIKAVVSLELADYKLTRAALNAVNIDSIEFEIPDWSSPSMNQLYEYNQLLDKYSEYNVATHCWGGYGRTGIFLASRLIHTQEVQSAQEAMFLVREHYSEHAIEMKAQYNALARFADSYGLPASVSVSSLDFHWDSEHGNDGLEFDPGHNGDNTGISHPELDIFDLVLHASGAYNIETIPRVNQKKESFSESESESDEVINAQFLGDLASLKINTQRRLSTSSL
ncbi:RHS repeat-associated core domain-containing protein [Proteus faecis]|uniref:RHS repeat-associated core domain-containing protein n=2 Tax=Gammaproteobacteria TaxID=1236 RepID=UPI003075E788